MTAPKPGPAATTACGAYLPTLDKDGTNWRVWCCGVRGHQGWHRTIAGLQFEADALDEG